jgi:hypothetical protein
MYTSYTSRRLGFQVCDPCGSPNFKTLLARRNAIDRWHDFDAKATERALRDWCELNDVALAD